MKSYQLQPQPLVLNNYLKSLCIINEIRYDAESLVTKFEEKTTIDDISASVELLDFSTDNFYLIYKDSFLKITIVNLTEMRSINSSSINHDLQW